MTESMIQRATSAAMNAMGDGPGSRDYLRATAIARAVLTKIGEPDAATLKAGAEADAEGSETNARDVWQAMLGAVLAQG